MSEPKTTCQQCERPILQRTADKYDGLCVPCYARAAAIPPPDFLVPEDLASQWISLGEEPEDYRQMVWQHGAEFAYGYVERQLEERALFHEWSPRLFAFAAECRKARPGPSENSANLRIRAKQAVCESKILAEGRFGRGSHSVTICQLPLEGMAVAKRLWSSEEGLRVLLTEEEEDQWYKIYQHPKNAFWWFTRFRLFILDSFDHLAHQSPFRPSREDLANLAPGQEPWVVTRGRQIAGFSEQETELWAWDGHQAAFVKEMFGVIS